jgi:plastocyanin
MTAKKAVVVKVTEKEYSLALSVKIFKPGSYVFMAMDRGRLAHSLEINGPGVRNKRIPGMIAPGRSKSLKVVLREGSYRIWCPVPGHAGLGMKATIKVGASLGSGATTSFGTTTKSAWA